VNGAYSYDDYHPAYRFGWESRERHAGRRFDDMESDLGQKWDAAKGKSRRDAPSRAKTSSHTYTYSVTPTCTYAYTFYLNRCKYSRSLSSERPM
jgi:hypothetical protein